MLIRLISRVTMLSVLALLWIGAVAQADNPQNPTTIEVSTPVYRPDFSAFDPNLGRYTYRVSWEGIPAAELVVDVDQQERNSGRAPGAPSAGAERELPEEPHRRRLARASAAGLTAGQGSRSGHATAERPGPCLELDRPVRGRREPRPECLPEGRAGLLAERHGVGRRRAGAVQER